MTTPQPATAQVRCRLTVRVDDPAAVTALAGQNLRAANIDWDDEEDDLESAAAELGTQLLNSIASMADPDHRLAGVPGVEVTAAHVWAEPTR